jgi:hypothetical protein
MMLIPNTRREHNTLSHQNMPVEAVVMGGSIYRRVPIALVNIDQLLAE